MLRHVDICWVTSVTSVLLSHWQESSLSLDRQKCLRVCSCRCGHINCNPWHGCRRESLWRVWRCRWDPVGQNCVVTRCESYFQSLRHVKPEANLCCWAPAESDLKELRFWEFRIQNRNRQHWRWMSKFRRCTWGQAEHFDHVSGGGFCLQSNLHMLRSRFWWRSVKPPKPPSRNRRRAGPVFSNRNRKAVGCRGVARVQRAFQPKGADETRMWTDDKLNVLSNMVPEKHSFYIILTNLIFNTVISDALLKFKHVWMSAQSYLRWSREASFLESRLVIKSSWDLPDLPDRWASCRSCGICQRAQLSV